jgi:pyruvate formate lyase activating enzyme
MTHAYGNPCIISVDPIEKLPLAHFLPGEKSLSLAVAGCNVRCLYCQNWQQSQVRPEDIRCFPLPPTEAVRGAQRKRLPIIAYTYTEPVAWSEYMADVAAQAQGRGIRNVCATAAFIHPEPLRELCQVIDAFAIALKGFDETFYEKVVGATLEPVLKAMEIIRAEGKWLEVVTLIVPTLNDDLKKIRAMCVWIRQHLGAEVPVHFGRFVPEYKLRNLPRTPIPTLERCREVALEEGLQYVYLFNVAPHEGSHTYCPRCKGKLIERLGFKVLSNRLNRGTCPRCGTEIPGVWAKT